MKALAHFDPGLPRERGLQAQRDDGADLLFGVNFAKNYMNKSRRGWGGVCPSHSLDSPMK